MPPLDHTPSQDHVQRAESAVNAIILGKRRQVRLALACLLADGHLLIEDLPGMGKTTLATTLARVFGLAFNRIQFTSDLLPADIVGANVFDRNSGSFEFHPGPIFAQMVLADEINRATPRTQSALLEGMEERRVSVDGESHALERPFFVIATQNPSSHLGTYDLPESQLDRFLMRISLGFPDEAAERALLNGDDPRRRAETQQEVMAPAALTALQAAARSLHVSDALLDYLTRLLSASRGDDRFRYGLSPRAGRGILAAARAYAMLSGRDHVLPDDVQAVLPATVDHRMAPQDPYATTSAAAVLLAEVEPV